MDGIERAVACLSAPAVAIVAMAAVFCMKLADRLNPDWELRYRFRVMDFSLSMCTESLIWLLLGGEILLQTIELIYFVMFASTIYYQCTWHRFMVRLGVRALTEDHFSKLPPEILAKIGGFVSDKCLHDSFAKDFHSFERINKTTHDCIDWGALVKKLRVTIVPSAAPAAHPKLLLARFFTAKRAQDAFYEAFRAGDTKLMRQVWFNQNHQTLPEFSGIPPKWVRNLSDLPEHMQDDFEDHATRTLLPTWDQAFCRHPGWTYIRGGLRGHHEVCSSWDQILGNGASEGDSDDDLQVIPHEAMWELSSCGRVARCHVDEELEHTGSVIEGMFNAYAFVEHKGNVRWSAQIHDWVAHTIDRDPLFGTDRGYMRRPFGNWRMIVHDTPNSLRWRGGQFPGLPRGHCWVDPRGV